MAKFSQDNPPIRVLMVDAHITGFDLSKFPYTVHDAFFKSIGAHVEWIRPYDITANSQILQDDWDLMVIPWAGNATAQYSTLKALLPSFIGSNFPIWYGQTFNAAGASAQPTTGITAVNSVGKFTSTGLINWEGRQAGQVTFYGEAPTIAGAANVTTHATDLVNDAVMLWSNDVEGHPSLFMSAYNSQDGTIAKPWLGAQWMIDQCPTEERKAQIIAHINKRHILLRIDALGDNNSQTSVANGDLDIVYNALKDYGVNEVWLAALWSSGGTLGNKPDYNYPEAVAWFLARDKSKGGLFRCMQHETDIVNGISYTPDERCTTDGINPDGFKNADTIYRAHCDMLTDMGFELGSDGYGKGNPNVQNANDMNNPSAHFLTGNTGVYDTDGFYGGFGNHLWLSGDEDYPTGLTPQTNIKGSIVWAEGQTLLGYSQDSIVNSSVTDMPVLWNIDVCRCLINGGGLYYHTGASFDLPNHVSEYGQLHTSCPDIIANSTWEEMLVSLKKGTGVFFDL